MLATYLQVWAARGAAPSRGDARVPQYGDVVLWSTVASGYGHVAIFLRGDANQFVSLDQNWGQPRVAQISHNYNHVLGWLRPRNQAAIGSP